MVHLPALSHPVSRGIVHINENAALLGRVCSERINFKTRQGTPDRSSARFTSHLYHPSGEFAHYHFRPLKI